jgi:hypothetical protein
MLVSVSRLLHGTAAWVVLGAAGCLGGLGLIIHLMSRLARLSGDGSHQDV